LIAGLALAGALAGATRASAATLGVSSTRLQYAAAPAERNNPNVVLLGPSLALVTDTAPLTANGLGPCLGLIVVSLCVPVNGLVMHQPLTGADVWLGDGNDSFTSPAFSGEVDVWDGTGSDRVDISRAARGHVFAGDSTDPDVLIGNHNQALSLPGNGVNVTLNGLADDGTPGEHDNISGFGIYAFGPGNDKFVGDERGEYVVMGGGSDNVLLGNGPDRADFGPGLVSYMRSGGGNDLVTVKDVGGSWDLGPGDDTLIVTGGMVFGIVTCGEGDDTLIEPFFGAIQESTDCEHIRLG
jgi:hypothetical protein